MSYTLSHISECIETAAYISSYCNPTKFIEFCKCCDKYNSCWACPPYSYNPIERISAYKYTYIIGTKVTFNEQFIKDSTDSAKNREIIDKVMTDVRAVIDPQLMQLETSTPHSLALFAGTCHLCPQGCTRPKSIPCRYPEKIRPSLEAYGFDISKTTESLLNIPLKWSKQGELPTYLILVSGFMSNSKVHTDILDTFRTFL